MTTLHHMTAEVVTLPRRSEGRTLPQLLRDNAATFGTTPAIRSKRAGLWRTVTWAELYRRVRRMAVALDGLGLQPKQIIALISENREEAWVTQMAALSLGAIAVSVYPDATADELGYVLGHSGAVFALGEDQEQIDKILACRDRAPALKRIVFVDARGLWHYDDPALIGMDEALRLVDDADDAWLDARIDGARQEDVAVLCYTSGTTSRPKAAMLGHAFILDNAYRLMASLRIRAGGNYLSYISPAWAAEQFFGVALPMLAPLVLHFAEKPETIQTDLREIGPEFLMFTPHQWEMMASDVEARMMVAPRWRQRLFAWGLRQGRRRAVGDGSAVDRAIVWPLADQLVLKGVRDLMGLTQAQAVLSGGSGLSAELFGRFRAFGVPLGNLYGSSELGLIATHGPDDDDPETMGRLMPSDPSITGPMEAWVDADGQLRMKVLAFSGYLGDERTGTEMDGDADGYETGDAVRIDGSGQLIFLDRVKDLRRLSTGQTYPPQFLENHLRASPMVRDAIVIGDASRDRVVALVNVDMAIAGRFAEREGLAFGTFTELSQLDAVRAEVARAVAAVNRIVEPGSRIAAFANLPKELDADEEELTRSRKLRRGAIEAKYAALIDGLYAGAGTVACAIDVTYQDGRKSRFQADVFVNVVEDAG